MKPVAPEPPPRLALTIAEAAQAIGLSETAFRKHCLDAVKQVRVGSAVVIPVAELRAYLERESRWRVPE